MVLRHITAALFLSAFWGTLVCAEGNRTEAVSLLPGNGDQELSMPFSPGEELKYEINWKPIFLFPAFSAGEIRFRLDSFRYDETDTFKISAWATSGGVFQSLMGLDIEDYFEAVVDAEAFRSYRYVYQSRHNRRMRDLEIVIDYQTRKRFLKELDSAVSPPRVLRDEVLSGIPAPITDTLSVFYAARLRELKKGQRYFIHLNDSGKIQEVQLEVVKQQTVRIGLGEYQTVKISTVGEFFRGAGDFHVWYSLDSLRVPVKFEADVRFGKIYGELIHLQTPGMSKSRVRIP